MVLIASPFEAVRRRWRQALAGSYPTHEVRDKAALYQCMAELKPAVLLLDHDRGHFGAIRHLSAIFRRNSSTRVVLLTSNPTHAEGVAAIKAGAKGYCHKNVNGLLLRKTVEMVKKGEIWVCRRLGSALLEELTALSYFGQQAARAGKEKPSKQDGLLNALSRREREVAYLIGNGEHNKGISSRLNISEKTVKAHLTMIFRKLGVSDRLRLALFMTKHTPARFSFVPGPSTEVSFALSPIETEEASD